MFEVHCDELIRALAKRAEAVCNKLLARMSSDHLDTNKAYVTFLSFDMIHVELSLLAVLK